MHSEWWDERFDERDLEPPRCPMGHTLKPDDYVDDEEVYCEVCGWHCPKDQL